MVKMDFEEHVKYRKHLSVFVSASLIAGVSVSVFFIGCMLYFTGLGTDGIVLALLLVHHLVFY